MAGNPATYRLYLNVRYDILGSEVDDLVTLLVFLLTLATSWNVQTSIQLSHCGLQGHAPPSAFSCTYDVMRGEVTPIIVSEGGLQSAGGDLRDSSAARSQEDGKRRQNRPEQYPLCSIQIILALIHACILRWCFESTFVSIFALSS